MNSNIIEMLPGSDYNSDDYNIEKLLNEYFKSFWKNFPIDFIP